MRTDCPCPERDSPSYAAVIVSNPEHMPSRHGGNRIARARGIIKQKNNGRKGLRDPGQIVVLHPAADFLDSDFFMPYSIK